MIGVSYKDSSPTRPAQYLVVQQRSWRAELSPYCAFPRSEEEVSPAHLLPTLPSSLLPLSLLLNQIQHLRRPTLLPLLLKLRVYQVHQVRRVQQTPPPPPISVNLDHTGPLRLQTSMLSRQSRRPVLIDLNKSSPQRTTLSHLQSHHPHPPLRQRPVSHSLSHPDSRVRVICLGCRRS